jgi:hypothetical protein
MHWHSRRGKRRAAVQRKRRARIKRRHVHRDSFGFIDAFTQLLGGRPTPTLARRRGRKPRVALKALLAALVFHVMQRTGTLGEHFALLFADSLSDGACSDRRQRLPWHVFEELMQCALRPLARRRGRREGDGFWRGWRLVALDGTQFSVCNTPQNQDQLPKAKTRRGRAAFAKIVTGVLLELGLHNPLAAAIGQQGESEWQLAGRLLAHLPARALLLADRLHGCAAFAAEALTASARVGSHFLFRARSQIKARTVRRFKDGSRLLEVPLREKGRPRRIVRWLRLREIRVRVARPGQRAQELRLWTNLLEPKDAPAPELARLYAQRWEHELYYRQLKRQLRKSELLQSHTVTTAAQEIAALVLASAVLARERQRAAAGKAAVLRISFMKILELMRPLWLVFALGPDLLDQHQKRQLTERFLRHARTYLVAPKRTRSCPRALRQPVSKWPRLLKNESHEGPLHFTFV